MRLTAFLAVALTLLPGSAEDTMTGVFNDRIRTLQVYGGENPFGLPVIMGPADGVTVSFDHLADDREFFRYTLTHCDANWQPSQLLESDYLDGFNEGTIDDYAFSEATTVHYVHYTLSLPNQQMAPVKSGNYLLRVHPESNPDSTVLQCRFMISEQTAPVAVSVTPRTDIDYQQAHQQLEVRVDTERAQVEDPFNDLLVVVGQDGRLDSEAAIRQPMRMLGHTAVFEHRQELIFEAGKEYRRFETVSDYYPGMGVESVGYYRPYYHYTLQADAARDEEPYEYDQDQNGRFLVRRLNATDSDVEADYGVVHFTLEVPEMPGYMIFIDGDMVNRRFDPNSRMQYNAETGAYQRALLLKQGSYNYRYLAVPPGGRRGYTKYLEGDDYRTENEYLVRVYHRRRGERYDRLIGVGYVRSE